MTGSGFGPGGRLAELGLDLMIEWTARIRKWLEILRISLGIS